MQFISGEQRHSILIWGLTGIFLSACFSARPESVLAAKNGGLVVHA